MIYTRITITQYLQINEKPSHETRVLDFMIMKSCKNLLKIICAMPYYFNESYFLNKYFRCSLNNYFKNT